MDRLGFIICGPQTEDMFGLNFLMNGLVGLLDKHRPCLKKDKEWEIDRK